MTQLVDHDEPRTRDLVGKSVRVSFREGGILSSVDDQGGYLNLWQPVTPAWGLVDKQWDG